MRECGFIDTVVEGKLDLAALKHAIDVGMVVRVAHAFGSTKANDLGDLREIGYARKEYIADRRGEVERIDWFYSGPFPIIVGDDCVTPQTWIE